jgi:hypothetical protein
MAKASHALSAPRRGCNPAPAVLQDWRAAATIWAALSPSSPKNLAVCSQLLELRVRLGPEAVLLAREAAHA